jgi:hypothetical protein
MGHLIEASFQGRPEGMNNSVHHELKHTTQLTTGVPTQSPSPWPTRQPLKAHVDPTSLTPLTYEPIPSPRAE